MENLNPSLPLITLTLLTLYFTTIYLFLNHRCYLKNIFYTKPFPTWIFEMCIMSSVFFNIWNPSRMTFTCSEQWKNEFVKYWNLHEDQCTKLKFAWRPVLKHCNVRKYYYKPCRQNLHKKTNFCKLLSFKVSLQVRVAVVQIF